MSRIFKSLIAVVAVGLTTVGIAAAASTPAVTAESAINVANTTATLTATINPNGSATGYSFQYGPTSAYGLSTNSHRIGAGTRPVTVHINIAGLTPGTPYHFHVCGAQRRGNGVGRRQGLHHHRPSARGRGHRPGGQRRQDASPPRPAASTPRAPRRPGPCSTA